MQKKSQLSALSFVGLVVLAGLASELGWLGGAGPVDLPPWEAPRERVGVDAPSPRLGGAAIAALHAAERSGVVVEEEGVVSKVLSDDNEGSRHQRFILRLDSGHTVLVSHNIDLAPRVADLRRGDDVALRGQYEWNERGGVVHWTHHDPQGRRPGGWIRHEGHTYR